MEEEYGIETTRFCDYCGEDKPITAFIRQQRTKKSGEIVAWRQHRCRDCAMIGHINGTTISKAGIIYNVLKNNSYTRKKPVKVNITRKEFKEWYDSQEQKCHYCGRTLDEVLKSPDPLSKRIFRLTVDRRNSEKGYDKGNLVLACYRCNWVKSNFFTEQEMIEIGKIIHKKFNQPCILDYYLNK
jgi:hypothetical protein